MMRLASEPRNLRLPKLAARSKKVRNTAQYSAVFLLLYLGQLVIFACLLYRLVSVFLT